MSYIKECRMCKGKKIEKFLDLGKHTLMNSLVTKAQTKQKQPAWPLQVGFCHKCHLVQLMYIVDSRKIYQAQDYLYFSSDMPNLDKYFAEYVEELTGKYLKDGGLIVEIGSNDGIVLKQFKPPVTVLGVDPSTNVALRALKRGVPTVADFFTYEVARKIRNEWGPAKVVTGSNCIAHLSDLHDMTSGVAKLLDDDGVFVVEANYWGGMVDNLNYGLIYLDHFSFFSVEVWETFGKKFGLRPFDAYVTPAQGGSLRLFMCKDGRPQTERFKALQAQEKATKLNTLAACKEYARKVNQRRKEIKDVLRELSKKGKVVAGYGAAAKGLSILKSSEAGKESIKFFVDDSPAKQGFFTPESHIPIYRRDEVKDPDYFMVLAPNYAEVIMQKEQEYIKRGGKFIVPRERIEIYPN